MEDMQTKSSYGPIGSICTLRGKICVVVSVITDRNESLYKSIRRGTGKCKLTVEIAPNVFSSGRFLCTRAKCCYSNCTAAYLMATTLELIKNLSYGPICAFTDV